MLFLYNIYGKNELEALRYIFTFRPIFPIVAAPWMRLWTWHYRYKAEVDAKYLNYFIFVFHIFCLDNSGTPF